LTAIITGVDSIVNAMLFVPGTKTGFIAQKFLRTTIRPVGEK